jgi:hypothetical protein
VLSAGGFRFQTGGSGKGYGVGLDYWHFRHVTREQGQIVSNPSTEFRKRAAAWDFSGQWGFRMAIFGSS